MRDGKNHYIAVSFLIVILILAAIILNLRRPADLQVKVSQEIESQEEIVAESPVPFETAGINPYDETNSDDEDLSLEINSKCQKIDFEVFCRTQHSLYPCININDGNITSEWFAGYSCSDNRAPCVVNNNVEISTNESFQFIKLYNRLSPDFYINRVLIDYNDYSEVSFRGGQKYSQEPWIIELLEPTQEISLNIVEIMGVGYRYQTGLAEIQLYDCIE